MQSAAVPPEDEQNPSQLKPIRVAPVFPAEVERRLRLIRSAWFPLVVVLLVPFLSYALAQVFDDWFSLAVPIALACAALWLRRQRKHYPSGNVEYYSDRMAIHVAGERHELVYGEIIAMEYSFFQWRGGHVRVTMSSGKIHVLPATISRPNYFLDRVSALRPDLGENLEFVAFRDTAVAVSQYWESRSDARKHSLHNKGSFSLEVFLFALASTGVLLVISGSTRLRLTAWEGIGTFIANLIVALVLVYLGRTALIDCGHFLNRRRILARVKHSPTDLKRDRKAEVVLWRKLLAPYLGLLVVMVIGLGSYEYLSFAMEKKLNAAESMESASSAQGTVPDVEAAASTDTAL